jgi:hypothetical protein
MSLSPGFWLSIFAGVVYQGQQGLDAEIGTTNLAVSTALEEGCHPNEANVVVPHDGVGGVFSRNLEVVVEY